MHAGRVISAGRNCRNLYDGSWKGNKPFFSSNVEGYVCVEDVDTDR